MQPRSLPILPGQKLNARQEKFAEIYAKKRNATLSAIEAGYSRNGAEVQGHRLLTNAKLQQRIAAYGQLGLDSLAEIAYSSQDDRARVQASIALTERAYGKPQNNDNNRGNIPNIVISFNKINTEGKVVESNSIVRGGVQELSSR